MQRGEWAFLNSSRVALQPPGWNARPGTKEGYLAEMHHGLDSIKVQGQHIGPRTLENNSRQQACHFTVSSAHWSTQGGAKVMPKDTQWARGHQRRDPCVWEGG